MKISTPDEFEYPRKGGPGRPTIYGVFLTKVREMQPGEAGVIEDSDLPESARGIEPKTLKSRLTAAIRAHVEPSGVYYRVRVTTSRQVVVECHPKAID